MGYPVLKKVLLVIFSFLGVLISYNLTIHILISTHSFLALTRPVKAEVLVVEGWLFDYMLEQAAKEIVEKKYNIVITTGFEHEYGQSSVCFGLKNSAECCKRRLTLLGIDESLIDAVPAGRLENERTFHTASAIKSWLLKNDIKRVNVFTGGPHGRKSLVLFQKALGKDIKVGIISCRIKHYDPVYWWTSQRGVWVTLRYLTGYFYALLR